MQFCAPVASSAVSGARHLRSRESYRVACATLYISWSQPIAIACLGSSTPACCPIRVKGVDSLIFKSVFIICVFLWSGMFQSPQFDLLIKNGRIVDGSGRAAYVADLGIKGDRIVSIGKLSQATATRTIDAHGLVVAPGFIDMLGQSETYLLIDPRAMSKVMMGVTTEITGEGESIAPINDRLIKEQEDFNRRYKLTIDWRTLDQYFKRLEQQGSGVNLATFVGATQVRAYVIGYDNRPPTAAEFEQMKQLVRDAMKEGALGVSTSLQYVPARFAKTDEIVELAK